MSEQTDKAERMIRNEEPEHESIEDLMDFCEGLLDIEPSQSGNLDQLALDQTRHYHKIQRKYIFEGRYLGWALRRQASIKLLRRKYYLGVLPSKVYASEPLNPMPAKSEINEYLKGDHMMLIIDEIVENAEQRVKYLEQALQRVRDRGYDIKNAIEWRKVVEG